MIETAEFYWKKVAEISDKTGTDWHRGCTASENHECSGKNISGGKSISEISAGIRRFCKEISDNGRTAAERNQGIKLQCVAR